MTSAQGRCHICKGVTLITFCRLCDHWFCEVCRGQYWSNKVYINKMMMAQKHFEPDLIEMLKMYGGVEYTEVHPNLCDDGELYISQVDAIAMAVKLASLEDV